ncbi:MAG: radical SAM protein, partial [Verrucomicrobiae bacterium]|nr:radical SAM protein [Verrucomicrobiae bacterium]
MTSPTNQLRLLFWETTAGCNLECAHCRRLDVSRQLMNNDLSTEEAIRFVAELARFAKPILVLSGGEPLIRPDIFEIATHACNSGLAVALATNGTLITQIVAEKIVPAGIR